MLNQSKRNNSLCFNIPFTLIVIIFFLFQIVQAETTKEAAIELVLNDIIKDYIGKVDVYVSKNPISSQQGLQLWNEGILSCPYDNSWVFFIDDFPFANWYHSCRYIFVDTATGKYQILNQSIYPENYERDFELISGVVRPKPRGLITNPEAIIEVREPNPNLYAVIINGCDWGRYWRDISAIYCTLIQEYGYTKENIFVHYVEGSSSMGDDLDNDGSSDIDYDAYKTTLERTFRNLSGEWTNDPNVPELGPEDQLFVFIDDHGNGDGLGHSWVMLPGPDLHDYELADFVEDIHCAQMIFVMEPCFSGGFVDDLSDYVNYNVQCEHRAIHTACDDDESSWAELWITGADYDEFVYYWIAAARGYYPGNNPWELGEPTGNFPFHNYFSSHPGDYNPDMDGDGMIQMEEAFDYSNNLDTWSPDGFYYPYYSGTAEHPISFQNVGFQEDLLSLSGISGNVVNTQTVSGNFLLCGDLTVNNSVNLTIDSGTSLYFPMNTRLYINGDLSDTILKVNKQNQKNQFFFA